MECMNKVCGNMMSVCKRGWQLESGAFAVLCLSCGDAYDDSNYCLLFHKKESGWRDCKFCNVPIHCGCVASKHLHETLNTGEVVCKKCNIDTEKWLTTQIPNWSIGTGSSSRLGTLLENKQVNLQRENTGQGLFDLGKNKKCKISESSLNPPTFRPSILSGPGSSSGRTRLSSFLDSVNRQSSDSPLTSSSSSLNNALTHANRRGNTATHIKGKTARVAIKNRLRGAASFIPKMSELEIAECSKLLNSQIVPLFEKILTATDVSKTGRFSVPKSYARKYFPEVKNADGVGIQMLDIKNRNWEFQLKYVLCHGNPTYYLDGAYPFFLNMEVRPYDTVTFSMMIPSEMLVIGYRKADQQNQEHPSAQSSPSFLAFSNQRNQQDPSPQSSSAYRADVIIASDSEENTLPNVENSVTPSKKRARKGKETMISTMSWGDGQGLLFPPVSRNHTVVMVDRDIIEEYNAPPLFGAEPSRPKRKAEPSRPKRKAEPSQAKRKAEPTSASTSSHLGRHSRRKLDVPLKWNWGRLHSGSTSRSAQLPVEVNGEKTAQLPAESNGEATAQLPVEANGEKIAQLPAEANGEATAQLPVETNGEMMGADSDDRIFDLSLTYNIQDESDLELSDSEGIIEPGNLLE